MEGAPVTAATGVLGPVVAKLGALLGSEYKLRRRTRKDVRFIRSKLKSVHSILWAIWEKEDLDAESKELKKEALDLADDVHDAVDDFILAMVPSRRNKHLMVQSKIEASCRFQDFRTRVDQVSGRCRSKWKCWEKNKLCAEPISSLFSRKNARSSAPSKSSPPRAPFFRKDPSEIVGMEKWRRDLIRYLVGAEEGEESTMVQPQLKMASIVGMAGVGKTTLADLVYEEIGNKFQCRAFVSVTPNPKMKEVLTSILQQVGAEPLAGTQARKEEDIIHTISNFLEDKRYLVIVDDIWHHGEWDFISKSFPQNNLGSGIVMTTRNGSVPGDDFANNKLCIRLNTEWDFILQKWMYGPYYKKDVAARMKPDMVGEGFDSDHPIVDMCGCVPLALLCMFSAMAMVREQQEQIGVHLKTCDVQDKIFKQVKQNGIQNTPGFEPLVESLKLGYDDLPHHMLKTCLLYCSIYPENYLFVMDDLVMRWVTEGFICKEDAGKGYFEELGDRGLLMLDKHDLDRIYRMNPMMQNFLRWKSREDNFSTCSSDITSECSSRIHRLCIDDDPEDDGAAEGVDSLSGLDWSQIRSLVVLEGAERYVPFEKLECVRVLDLQCKEALQNDDVKDICGLLRVRHLYGLHGKGISEIPPEIARLQYLETLEVIGTSITELPGEIGDLQQLKTLDVSCNQSITSLPQEIWKLRHLKTLLVLYCTKITRLPSEIENLQKLDRLALSHNKGITELPREIGQLQNLKILEVNCTGITMLPSEIWNLQNLETLNLSYNKDLKKVSCEIGKLQNLKLLELEGTNVVKLPREVGGLKKLENLKGDIGVLPWEAGQLLKLKGVPKLVRRVWKNSDLVSELAREILCIRMTSYLDDKGGLIVGTKHMHIPRWIKDHFNDLGSLDIRMCKLEEQDLKILRDMPNLKELTLRLEVVPRNPIAISGEGFTSLRELVVDCRVPPVITFQEGAMPRLYKLDFEFRFNGGPPATANEDPQLGIKHLRRLWWVTFKCNEKWYGGAAGSESMSAMIDVVRKEAQEHPNEITFQVSGRWFEKFPAAKKESAQEASSSTGGNLLCAEMEEETFPAMESSQQASSSNASGMGRDEEER